MDAVDRLELATTELKKECADLRRDVGNDRKKRLATAVAVSLAVGAALVTALLNHLAKGG